MSNTVSGGARGNWLRIALTIIAGTAACLMLSLGLNYLLLLSDSLTPFGRSAVSAILLPLAIGIPLFAFVGIKREELRRYKRALNRAASRDPLTDCLNGAVFTSMLERRSQGRLPAENRKSAFLVVETEKLRSINMRFGHGWGDEALKLVATVIRVSVRSGDIIGRIGVDEFGIFLPGATEENALQVGERIRAGVAAAYFAPQGEADALEVRVGGVVFDADLAFDEMFKAAERQLVDARKSDRLQLSFIERGDPSAAH